jgi:uncharacterized protein (DUF4415 family)
MRKRKNDDYDMPELTARDFKRMRPAREVHPGLVEAYERTRGRPRKAVTKVAVTLRLDPDVVAALRASGAGWQTRTNAILAKWVRKTPAKRLRG